MIDWRVEAIAKLNRQQEEMRDAYLADMRKRREHDHNVRMLTIGTQLKVHQMFMDAWVEHMRISELPPVRIYL